jgi:hypothetical protein
LFLVNGTDFPSALLTCYSRPFETLKLVKMADQVDAAMQMSEKGGRCDLGPRTSSVGDDRLY